MSTTSATSTTTPPSLSSTTNATPSLSSVPSNSAHPLSGITTVTTSTTTVSSTMSTFTSASSSSSSAMATSSAMPSSTSSISTFSTLATSESSSSSHTTSLSSISTIPSFTSSSTLPPSTTSSLTTTQDPLTSTSQTSQTTSSQTIEPAATSSSRSSSSPAPPPAPTSSTIKSTSAATTPILPTTTHTTQVPSASGVLTETTITSIFTTTSNGKVVTITQVSVSQTLSSSKSNSKDNSFFQNTGAVAGVFVVVGLAAASIVLWILFALRRRRRTRRLEHDTAVSATLAAAGFHRTPLDDDDENENANGSRRSRFGSPELEMQNRASSGFASTILSGARTSTYLDHLVEDSLHLDDPDAYNPYREYVADNPAAVSGTNPPFPPILNGPYRDRTSSGGEHAHENSTAGSYEPLLASYYRQEQAASLPVLTSPPNLPPRSPLRLSDAGRSPPLGVLSKTLPDISPAEKKSKTDDSCVSSGNAGDERLDPSLRQRMNEESDRASQRDLRDEEDYSRPVLGVRNLLNASEASQEA